MKTLAYLDQSFASSLAASRTGRLRAAQMWGELDNALKDAVLVRETVICPKTRFHFEEASLDTRRRDDILRVVDQYSGGVSFLHWSELLDNQISDALNAFLGSGPSDRSAAAFDEDPHAPLADRTIEFLGSRMRIVVDEHRPAEFVDEHRASKRRYVRDIERHRVQAEGARIAFDEAVQRQKQAFIHAHIVAPVLRFRTTMRQGRSPSLLDARNAETFLWLERELATRNVAGKGIKEFVLSMELAAVPFIDVYCSLYAAIDSFSPERATQEGDFDDVAILASVVPYCDVITTDSSMRDLCIKAGLGRRYGVEIYSPKAIDVMRLTEMLRNSS